LNFPWPLSMPEACFRFFMETESTPGLSAVKPKSYPRCSF
jgi:hypothetical protein